MIILWCCQNELATLTKEKTMSKNEKSSLMIDSKKMEKLTLQTAKGKSAKAINIISYLLNDIKKDERLNGVSAKTMSNDLGIEQKQVRETFRKVFGVGKPSENNNLKPFGLGVVNNVEYAVGISLKPTIHYHLLINKDEVNSFA
tara:strand:- start:279 stop:710 length:432 start_codon:yes stop_codon:yes gene_type:complete